MLSIEYCRKKIEKNGRKYTDEEVYLIRRKLYALAKITYKHLNKSKYVS